jgi:hypothetical protein
MRLKSENLLVGGLVINSRFHVRMVVLADPFSLLGRDLYIDRPAQGRLCRKGRDKDGHQREPG